MVWQEMYKGDVWKWMQDSEPAVRACCEKFSLLPSELVRSNESYQRSPQKGTDPSTSTGTPALEWQFGTKLFLFWMCQVAAFKQTRPQLLEACMKVLAAFVRIVHLQFGCFHFSLQLFQSSVLHYFVSKIWPHNIKSQGSN